MPLLRLDVGRVFGKYIGESEAGIRNAIRTAEAVAPAILWIDEIEKGFAGSMAEGHDTGVSARVLGTFLTWLQEKKKPVFVLATANSIRNLPPELLRKGRFDELFFIDLPTAPERAAIFRVHLARRRRDPSLFDLATLAAASDGYTGAEIEQAINEALHDAYADGRREPTSADLSAALKEIVPIAVTMRESIQAMRRWAESRARRASLPAPGVRSGRPDDWGAPANPRRSVLLGTDPLGAKRRDYSSLLPVRKVPGRIVSAVQSGENSGMSRHNSSMCSCVTGTGASPTLARESGDPAWEFSPSTVSRLPTAFAASPQ